MSTRIGEIMRLRLVPLAAAGALAMGAALLAPATVQADAPNAYQSHAIPQAKAGDLVLGRYKHLVVIYQENHSFDNLYGRWGRVGGDRVDGVFDTPDRRTAQIAQDGTRFGCLPQTDVNLQSPPLPASCVDAAHGVTSAFKNKPFLIDRYIKPTDKTCPAPGVFMPNGVPKDSPGARPGGCTRDLVHRFYQEQYQINGGRQNHYVTGSDAVGLTMGTYDTKQLPIYNYLHRKAAPHYVIADRFFQGAFGGSFLNHQWLIAGRAPVDSSHGAGGAVHSVIDANGMPTTYPQYVPTGPVTDGQLTVACPDSDTEDYDHACGDFAVNTVQPSNPPAAASGAKIGLIDDSLYPNIGDRMTDAGVSWAWYSGGWDDAVAGNPGPLFQFHHQPFNYFADYGPGQPGRSHLQDETDFFTAAATGSLPTVSFVKPYGAENEHPGYASASSGSRHLVHLVRAVMSSPQARSTLVLVTYDEFGGQWDHVPPPGKGSPTPGAHDAFGPGTRIPALLVSKSFRESGVDHRSYDTTSILATIERSFGLDPVGIRDQAVNALWHAVAVGGAPKPRG
jgi:acid phosphatase